MRKPLHTKNSVRPPSKKRYIVIQDVSWSPVGQYEAKSSEGTQAIQLLHVRQRSFDGSYVGRIGVLLTGNAFIPADGTRIRNAIWAAGIHPQFL